MNPGSAWVSASLMPAVVANSVSTGPGQSAVTLTGVRLSSARIAWLYESTNAFDAA